MTAPRLLLSALALLALSACKREDMWTQAKMRYYDRNDFFANHSTMRHPVAGTLARAQPWTNVPMPQKIDAAMLQRGRERFDIFCSPCHGRSGDGEGMIIQRGFPKPPSLFADRLRRAKADHFYDVITNGHGAMYSYAARLSPADRWAVIAYIRALQLSQDVQVASLPDEDRARLEKLP
jgi:mono/diheme cytochrome c family protein